MGRWSDRIAREDSAAQGRTLFWALLGFVALSFLGALAVARTLLAGPAPLTAGEVTAYARELEAALAQGDGGPYAARLDAEQLAARARSGHPRGELLDPVIDPQSLAEALLADLARCQARWTFVRVLPGQPVPVVFRELGARTLDYQLLYLARGADGQVAWVDRRSVRSGAWLSARLLREAARDLPFDVGAEDLRALDQHLEQLQALLGEGQDRKVLEAFYKVPRDLRVPELQLLRLEAAARIGDVAYASALKDLAAAEEGYDLALFEHLLAAGRFDAALEALDRLALSLGGDDAHLLALAARIRLQQGDLPRAAGGARQALQQEPTLLSALFTALDVALEQQDHPWTAQLLSALQAQGEDLTPDVEEAKAFAPFRASEAYTSWKQ